MATGMKQLLEFIPIALFFVVYQLDGDLNDERHAVAWGGQKVTRARLICRVVFHNGTHAGQILDLRRALGMPKLH